MNDTAFAAVVVICVTAVIVTHIWASTRRKYPR